MSLSKISYFFCISFIVGIGISSFLSVSQLTKLAFFIFPLIFLFFILYLFKKKRKIIVFSFCLIFVLTGVLVYQAKEMKISESGLNKYSDQGEVILEGVVSDEPDVREDNTKIEVDVVKVFDEKVKGKILITVGRYSDYNYGDKLIIKGEIKKPPVFDDFDYEKYLAKEGIYSVSYWPKVEKASTGEEGLLLAKIYLLKDKMRKVIHRNLSPPQSYILGSLILGDKSRMPESLKDKLSVSGLRHITAISGMHIVIISSVLMSFLIGIGLHRKYSFYLTIIFLVLFIVMIGMPASAVRAGIMVGFILLAQRIGRSSSSLRVIVFTAAGILTFNPLLLRYDVGFQLSFLAVLGIVVFSSFFEKKIKKVLNNNFFGLVKIISMTVSAQLFVFPLLIYHFGSFSLVTIFTNILVLPILPFLVGIGFLFVLSGLLFPFLGWILSWICWMFLTYIVFVINYFYKLSFSSIEMNSMPLSLLVISYSLLFLSAWWVWEKKEIKFLSY